MEVKKIIKGDGLMESLRDVRRKMQREIEKGRAIPLKFEKINVSEDSFKIITSNEQYKKIISWLFRIDEYRTGEATVSNNVYLRAMAKSPEFTRTKSVLDRLNLSFDAMRKAKKINPSYDNDCVLEEAICSFSLGDEYKKRCSYTYNGKETYGFMMSNPYILGLYCECESARADLAVNTDLHIGDSIYKKIIGLINVKSVLFQCLLFDDVWEEDGLICAKLYTIYSIE